MAELGAPYEQLWRLLSTRYGELEAARVVAKLVGAIVEHGEQLVAETLSAALTTPPAAPSAPRQPPATVPVPAALQRYRVEATPAAAYDALLAGGDR